MTHQELLDAIKEAMRERDTLRLSILRQVNGELKQIEVDERREITDADVVAMIKRTLKQTRETLEGSEKAGTDQWRTEHLAAQVEVLEGILPAQLSGDELKALAEEVVAALGATEKREMGRVMGELNARTDGNLDKAEAARIVGSLLS